MRPRAKLKVTKADIQSLIKRLEEASGADRELDARIHTVVASLADDPAEGDCPPYTASVKACFELIHQALPGWRWHVGYGVRGVFPYASLSDGRKHRYEAEGPTVPLVLLLALSRALAGVHD